MGVSPIWGARGSHLHADDGVDEEEHGDEQADVGQSLGGHSGAVTGGGMGWGGWGGEGGGGTLKDCTKVHSRMRMV